MNPVVGFAPHEVDTGAPTRSARLKWVIVVDESLPTGIATNAVACVAAATSPHVGGLLGPEATDAGGHAHPGLPWAGCSILKGSAEELAALHARAAASDTVFVADMPAPAQLTRVYDEYLEAVAATATDALPYYAVALVGPRNRIDKLTGRLPLL